MPVTIEVLRSQLSAIGEKLCGGTRRQGLFIIPDSPDYIATPWLEIQGEQYHFVVSERGRELERRVTTCADEILYWFVESNVIVLASDYASRHTRPDGDFRTVYFRKQYQLLLYCRPAWATRKRQQISSLLKSSR